MKALEIRNVNTLPYIGIAVTLFSWSLVPLFQKQLLSTLSPVELSFSRFFITAIFMVSFVLIAKRADLLKLLKNEPLLLFITTIFGPLSAMLLFNYGITSINVSVAAFLLTMEPIFTYLFAIAFKIEKWYVKRFFSVVVALVGVCLIILSKQGDYAESYFIGVIFLTLSPLVWAINTIITKKLVEEYSPISLVSVNFLLSSLMLIPFLSESYLPTVSTMGASDWGALLFCIFPGTIFGFTVWYMCLRFVSPTAISISFYLIPVITAMSGAIYLNESITTQMAIGILITLYGLYLVNIKNT